MLDTFDINLARGAVLILLIIAFLGIWAWAWSKKRKPEFHAASMLPLEEDNGTVPRDEDDKGKVSATERRPPGPGSADRP